MTITVVTHEAVRTNAGWVREEVLRVLDKLDIVDEAPLLRLDPGFALDVAETLGHATGVTVVPAQPNWLPMWQAYQRHHCERRLANLLANPYRNQPRFLAADEKQMVSFRHRDEFLARTGDTHVVVYDGRDRGSVVRYLQLVLGAQPVVLIDPAAKRTTLQKGDPCPKPTPSTALVPMSSVS